MIPIAFAYLGAGFLLSEVGLAVWRRASSRENTENRDGGSLRLLWIVISASITAAAFLASNGVNRRCPQGSHGDGSARPYSFSERRCAGGQSGTWAVFSLSTWPSLRTIASSTPGRTAPSGIRRTQDFLLQFAGLGLALGTLPSLLAVLILPDTGDSLPYPSRRSCARRTFTRHVCCLLRANEETCAFRFLIGSAGKIATFRRSD